MGLTVQLKRRRAHKPAGSVLPERGTSDGDTGAESEDDAHARPGEQGADGVGGGLMPVLPATQHADLRVGTGGGPVLVRASSLHCGVDIHVFFVDVFMTPGLYFHGFMPPRYLPSVMLPTCGTLTDKLLDPLYADPGKQVMPASSFEVGLDEARNRLELWGIVTIVDQALVEVVTPEVAAAGAEYGRLKGYAIFLRPETTTSGALRRNANDEGRIIMTNGEGGQRLQAPFHCPAKPRELLTSASIAELAEYEKRLDRYERARKLYVTLKPAATKAGELMSAVAGPGLRVRKAVVLVNEPVEPPVGAQCLHSDLTPFETGFVGLLALSRYTLLVSPGSHHAVQIHQSLMGRSAGTREADIMPAVPRPQLVRLVIEPGQLVLLHGNTIHAGDAGSVGVMAPRLHLYAMRESVKNETQPAVGLGPHFEAMFWT